MKFLKLILLIPILLTACATPYMPSENVLSIQQNLNREAALKIFAKRLQYGVGKNINMCAGDGGFAFDQTANPTIKGNIIHMKAYKLGDYVKGDRGFQVYKKAYYDKEIDLSKISRIDLYNKHTYPISRDDCFTSEDYRGSRKNTEDIALVYWIGALKRFTIRVPKKDADQFLAATRVIFPTAKIIQAKR